MCARPLLNKYLPVIIFAICILIAVVLAVSTPALWSAALAIAIAGAAMAVAIRVQLTGDSVNLSREVADLQKANAELRTEIQNSNSMIDELADVVDPADVPCPCPRCTSRPCAPCSPWPTTRGPSRASEFPSAICDLGRDASPQGT